MLKLDKGQSIPEDAALVRHVGDQIEVYFEHDDYIKHRAQEAARIQHDRKVMESRKQAATAIQSELPLFRQINAARAVIEILLKRIDDQGMTPEERDAIAKFKAMSDKIDSIRDISNQSENADSD